MQEQMYHYDAASEEEVIEQEAPTTAASTSYLSHDPLPIYPQYNCRYNRGLRRPWRHFPESDAVAPRERPFPTRIFSRKRQRNLSDDNLEDQKLPVYTAAKECGPECMNVASASGYISTSLGPNAIIAKHNAAEERLNSLQSSNSAPPQVSLTSILKVNKDTEPGKRTPHVRFVDDVVHQIVPGLLHLSPTSTAFDRDNIKVGSASTEAKKIGEMQICEVFPRMLNQCEGAKQTLSYYCKVLDIEVHFLDFPNKNGEMILTLVSMGTTPLQVCYAEASTKNEAHEKAALRALSVLSELGWENIPKTEFSNSEK